jgi:hypothetical protein
MIFITCYATLVMLSRIQAATTVEQDSIYEFASRSTILDHRMADQKL